jgi:hypothetical protein
LRKFADVNPHETCDLGNRQSLQRLCKSPVARVCRWKRYRWGVGFASQAWEENGPADARVPFSIVRAKGGQSPPTGVGRSFGLACGRVFASATVETLNGACLLLQEFPLPPFAMGPPNLPRRGGAGALSSPTRLSTAVPGFSLEKGKNERKNDASAVSGLGALHEPVECLCGSAGASLHRPVHGGRAWRDHAVRVKEEPAWRSGQASDLF